MARIRTIKPEFFVHEGLYDAEREEGLPMRLAYAGLWTQCDREGRFRWRPRTLKAAILPHDEVDFSRVLHAFATRGYLVKYACKGEEFGAILSFSRHQVINNKESASVLPQPDGSDCQIITCTRGSREPHASLTREVKDKAEGRKEGEGTGREGEREGTEVSSPTETHPANAGDGVAESLKAAWNDAAKKHGLAAVRALSPERRRQLTAFHREAGGDLGVCQRAFEAAADSYARMDGGNRYGLWNIVRPANRQKWIAAADAPPADPTKNHRAAGEEAVRRMMEAV